MAVNPHTILSTMINIPADLKEWSGPATNAWAVTPSDSTDYTQGYARALHVGTGGTVVLVLVDGSTVSIVAATGSRIDIWHKRVNSTSTTASNLVAMV